MPSDTITIDISEIQPDKASPALKEWLKRNRNSECWFDYMAGNNRVLHSSFKYRRYNTASNYPAPEAFRHYLYTARYKGEKWPSQVRRITLGTL
jgi:hypothetical protein